MAIPTSRGIPAIAGAFLSCHAVHGKGPEADA